MIGIPGHNQASGLSTPPTECKEIAYRDQPVEGFKQHLPRGSKAFISSRECLS